MDEITDGKSLKNISYPGWEGMFDINDYEDEIKRLNTIINRLILSNINTNFDKPFLRFGICNIVLDDANNDMSLTQINDMFRARIDKLDGKE